MSDLIWLCFYSLIWLWLCSVVIVVSCVLSFHSFCSVTNLSHELFYVLLIYLHRQVSREYDLHMNNSEQDLAMSQFTKWGFISGRETGGRGVRRGEAKARQRPRQRQRDGRLKTNHLISHKMIQEQISGWRPCFPQARFGALRSDRAKCV